MTNFCLFTRATPATLPGLLPYLRPGDLVWGQVSGIPAANSALTFPAFAALQQRSGTLDHYAAVNLDGEFKDANTALAEGKEIRQLVTNYNHERGGRILFTAFYHLNLIDAQPSLVRYPDVVLVGKTSWTAANVAEEAAPYLGKIRTAGRTPGILVGDLTASGRTKTPMSADQAHALADAVLSLDVDVLGVYYGGDDDSLLLGLLGAIGSAEPGTPKLVYRARFSFRGE